MLTNSAQIDRLSNAPSRRWHAGRAWADMSRERFVRVLHEIGGIIECKAAYRPCGFWPKEYGQRDLGLLRTSPTKMPAMPVRRGSPAEFLNTFCAVYCAFVRSEIERTNYTFAIAFDGRRWAYASADSTYLRLRTDGDAQNDVLSRITAWYDPGVPRIRRDGQDCEAISIDLSHPAEAASFPPRDTYAARRYLAEFFETNFIELPSTAPSWLSQ